MPRQATSQAEPSRVDDLRERASLAWNDLGDRAGDQIDSAPLIALAGGIALGALLAAVLPQPDAESRLLEPVGSRVADAGRGAVDRARETAREKVNELAGDRVREFLGFGGNS